MRVPCPLPTRRQGSSSHSFNSAPGVCSCLLPSLAGAAMKPAGKRRAGSNRVPLCSRTPVRLPTHCAAESTTSPLTCPALNSPPPAACRSSSTSPTPTRAGQRRTAACLSCTLTCPVRAGFALAGRASGLPAGKLLRRGGAGRGGAGRGGAGKAAPGRGWCRVGYEQAWGCMVAAGVRLGGAGISGSLGALERSPSRAGLWSSCRLSSRQRRRSGTAP